MNRHDLKEQGMAWAEGKGSDFITAMTVTTTLPNAGPTHACPRHACLCMCVLPTMAAPCMIMVVKWAWGQGMANNLL